MIGFTFYLNAMPKTKLTAEQLVRWKQRSVQVAAQNGKTKQLKRINKSFLENRKSLPQGNKTKTKIEEVKAEEKQSSKS